MRLSALLLLASTALACAAPRVVPPPVPAVAALASPPERAPRAAPLGSPRPVEPRLAPSPPLAPATAQPHRLSLDATSLVLPAGPSLVHVDLAPGRYVTLLLQGDRDALLGLDVVGPTELRPLRAHRCQDEDGLLPRSLAFQSPPGAESILLFVDVKAPVELSRADVPIPGPVLSKKSLPPWVLRRKNRAAAPPLVGLPTPLSRDDGYLLLSPSRYLFMRLDAADFMLTALRKTQRRFRGEPMGIADISQWNGERPATDLGLPRHISHEGGRDVDLAFPADDGGPSSVRPHCEGVLVEPDVYVCRAGTVRDLDALRLSFFVGSLLEVQAPGMVERIYMDEVYIEAMRKMAGTLREKRWLSEAAVELLFDDRLVRPSAWHVDHFHVRFHGEPGLATRAGSRNPR